MLNYLGVIILTKNFFVTAFQKDFLENGSRKYFGLVRF